MGLRFCYPFLPSSAFTVSLLLTQAASCAQQCQKLRAHWTSFHQSFAVALVSTQPMFVSLSVNHRSHVLIVRTVYRERLMGTKQRQIVRQLPQLLSHSRKQTRIWLLSNLDWWVRRGVWEIRSKLKNDDRFCSSFLISVCRGGFR